MGRSPCCSKEGLNRGAWTALEDKILTAYIKAHGEGKWRNLPKRAGLKRCGKSCRLRWLNYLRPDIKRGNITHDEEELIIRLHKLLGNRWSLIAGRLPGRTDNEIKNYWNTTLGKKANGQPSSSSSAQSKEETPQSKTSEALNSPPQVVIRTKATRCSKVIVSVQHPPQKLNVSKSKPTEDEDPTQKTPSPSNRDQNSGDSPRFGCGDLVGFGKFPPPEFLTGGGYGGYYDGRNLDLGDCDVGLSFEGPMLDDWTNIVCTDEDNATLDLESLAFLLDYEEWP